MLINSPYEIEDQRVESNSVDLAESRDSMFSKNSSIASEDLNRDLHFGNEIAILNNEIATIDNELWNLSQQEYYNEKKGLSSIFFKQIKIMKCGKVKSCCSICHNDFCKDEKIKKLPCGHIFHFDCSKSWLKISVCCPLCRFDVKSHFEEKEKKF